MVTRRSTLGILAAAIAVTPLAAKADYVLEPVLIHGKPASTVTTINAWGVIGGTFKSDHGFSKGFVLNGTAVTVIKKPLPNSADYNTPSPDSILKSGTVTGTIDGGDIYFGFVWRNGQYQQDFNSSGLGGLQRHFVRGNDSKVLIFNDYIGDGESMAFTGKTEPFEQITPGCGFPYVNSINRSGTVSGSCFFIPLNGIFVGQPGAYSVVYGPGMTNAFGGFVNDGGDIAGTYQDKAGLFHGFIRQGSHYTSFDAPVAITAMDVYAFSNTRFVAGTYTDTAGALHAFAYHHGQISDLAPPSAVYNGIEVTGVSDAGDVALDILDGTTGIVTPYIARCHGNVC